MATYTTSAWKLSDTYVNTLPFNTCTTAAGTAAKTIDVTNFALDTGAMVVVKFTNANTASNPTLNVSSTGAKAIYYKNAAISATYLKANQAYLFVYNGTQWDIVGYTEFPYVSQESDTSSSDLRVILSKTANDTTETGAVKKSSGFTFSPSTGTVHIGTVSDDVDDMEYVAGTGTLKVAGNIIAGSGSDLHGIFPAKDNCCTIGREELQWYKGYFGSLYEDNEPLSTKYAPKVHKSSTASTYGSASASVYGHAMASSTTPKAPGTAAVGSETAKFARGDHVHPAQTVLTIKTWEATD